MKKLITLVLVAAFVLGAFGVAKAAEIKIDGEFKANINYIDNSSFLDDEDAGDEDEVAIWGRARFRFNAVANDYLQAVVRTQFGSWQWGVGFGGIGGSANLTFNRAYLEFFWPGTDVLIDAGKYPVTLPDAGYFGNAFLDDNLSALSILAPINDMVSLLAVYARFNDDTLGAESSLPDDEWDAIVLGLPLTFEGLTVIPYGALTFLGQDAAAETTINGVSLAAQQEDVTYPWMIAVAATADFEPFTVYADLYYSSWKDDDADLEMSGWMIDAAVEYTGLDFLTPSLFVMWSSGLDNDDVADGEFGIMPSLAEAWTVGNSFWFGDSNFLSADLNNENWGTFVIGIQLADISFVEKLSHTLTAFYATGTNDNDAIAAFDGGVFGSHLADDDYIIEVDFNSKYQIYEELAAILEIAAIFPNFDEDVWGPAADDDTTAWKIAFGLLYKF